MVTAVSVFVMGFYNALNAFL